MRRVRLRPERRRGRGVADGVVHAERSGRIEPLDADRLTLPEPYTLLRPLDPPEVWCAGVTYERSRDARVEESAAQDVYTLVYDAERPELFLKDAGCRRTVGPGEPIGVRSDSRLERPRAGDRTRARDRPERSSASRSATTSPPGRSRARTRSTCRRRRSSPAPARSARRFSLPALAGPFEIRMRILSRDGTGALRGRDVDGPHEAYVRRPRHLPVAREPRPARQRPAHGHRARPPRRLHARAGHVVEIEVPGIGILANPVVSAASIARKEPRPCLTRSPDVGEELRRRRMARERERRELREAEPLAPVAGHRRLPRLGRSRRPRGGRGCGRGFSAWAALPPAQRAAYFGKAADAIEARAEQIAQDMTAEMGKPLREARLEAMRARPSSGSPPARPGGRSASCTHPRCRTSGSTRSAGRSASSR